MAQRVVVTERGREITRGESVSYLGTLFTHVVRQDSDNKVVAFDIRGTNILVRDE